MDEREEIKFLAHEEIVAMLQPCFMTSLFSNNDVTFATKNTDQSGVREIRIVCNKTDRPTIDNIVIALYDEIGLEPPAVLADSYNNRFQMLIDNSALRETGKQGNPA